jgi:hypothetical protein
MTGSWARLFLGSLFGLVFLFTSSYLLVSWLDPPAHAAQSAFIALGTSTALFLPAALAKLTPIRERRRGQPGFASKDESWLCYLVLMEAAFGVALTAIAPAWEWRMLGVAGAVGGTLMAGAIWTGRVQVELRR